MVAPKEIYISSISNVFQMYRKLMPKLLLLWKCCCLLSTLVKYAESQEDHCVQSEIHTRMRNVTFQSHLHLLTHISMNVTSVAMRSQSPGFFFFFFYHLCIWRSLKWVWTCFTCNITFFDESRVLRISRGETERMENKRYIMQKALSFISALFYAPLPPKPPSCWCQSSQELHTFPKTFIPICDFESLAGLR